MIILLCFPFCGFVDEVADSRANYERYGHGVSFLYFHTLITRHFLNVEGAY